MITPKNLVRHELIGLKVKIVGSTNKEIVGISGKVIDESRNTLTLEVNGKPKSFIKEECEFLFTIPSGEKVKVSGGLLVARPEDRIKKKLKSW
jgi:ribonuclease P protein subunit POP4